MSLLNDLDKTKMKNLCQGNKYKNTKNQYNNEYHNVFKYFFPLRETMENAKEPQGDPKKGDFMKYDFQVINFNNGPIRGPGDYTKTVLDIPAALKIAKADNNIWAVEIEKSSKKAYFRTQMRGGGLPMNGGEKPKMESNVKFITYLRPDNGMTEAETGASLSGSDAIMKRSNEESTEMMELKTKFESLMGQYEKKYKAYLDLIAKRKASATSALRNQIGKYNGKFYYINNFGIAREFTSSAWSGKPSSCTGTPVDIKESAFSKLQFGPPMGIGEICRNGGFNAKNKSTGLISWVDSNGFRHKYSDWTDKHKSCPQTTTELEAAAYNAMPASRDWGSGDECRLIDIDSPLHTQLTKLNDELIELSEKMKELVDDSDEKADQIDTDTANKKVELVRLLKKVNKEREKIKHVQRNINSIESDYQNKTMQVEALQFKYLVWAICGITMGVFCFKHIAELSKE